MLLSSSNLNKKNNQNKEEKKNNKEENNFIRLKRKKTIIKKNENNSQIFYNKPKAECLNPLDRFCEKLLDWEILKDNNLNTRNNNSTGNNNTNNNSNNEEIEENQQGNELNEVKDLYSSYSEYIRIWEPLLIKETQASIYSSLSLEENSGKCRIIPLDFDDKQSSVIKFQCAFGIDDLTSNRFIFIFLLFFLFHL